MWHGDLSNNLTINPSRQVWFSSTKCTIGSIWIGLPPNLLVLSKSVSPLRVCQPSVNFIVSPLAIHDKVLCSHVPFGKNFVTLC